MGQRPPLLSVCDDENPCEGMSRHATFENFGMAFLTLFQVSTGDNWYGIMKVLVGRLGRGTRTGFESKGDAPAVRPPALCLPSAPLYMGGESRAWGSRGPRSTVLCK